jgi:hypothetical protein
VDVAQADGQAQQVAQELDDAAVRTAAAVPRLVV